MPADILTGIIAASGAIILAGATYWLTKKREREAELRRSGPRNLNTGISG